MRLVALLPLLASVLVSAATWGFEDGSISVQASKTGSETGTKQSFAPESPVKGAVSLKSSESLRVSLTTTNGGKPRRPHQAFLTLTNLDNGLEEAFALGANDKGKAKFDLTQAKIPAALLASKKPLQASIVIGSFGSSKPLKSVAFSLKASADANSQSTAPASPRYSSLPEIHHIFRADPKSPPKIITLAFAAAALGALPVLLIVWGTLGVNLNHLSKAFAAAPISHSLFLGSVVSFEFIFWKYYTSWNLFQMLPAAGVAAVVAFISGSGALTEVQERRLNGER